MAKLAACVIVKDDSEASYLDRLLYSVYPHVDGIFVTGTKEPQKKIKEICEKFNAHFSFFKWIDDFSAARNFNFSQVPEEYGWLFWIDADDVVKNGENLKKIIAEAEKQKYTAIYFNYNYTIDPTTKQVLVRHSRERIVQRGKYEWKAPIHEVLIPLGKNNGVFSNLVEIDHYPPKKAEEDNMQRNLHILKKQYESQGNNKDPRTEYYLARAYFDLGKYKEAEQLFTDYLYHSGWDDERAMAWNYLGEINKMRDNFDVAMDCYLTAMKERPEYPTWYVNMAMVLLMQKKYDQALFWVKQALNVPQDKKSAMVLNPRDDQARALETLFFACFNLGMIDEAWAAAQKMTQLFPHIPEFKERFNGINSLRRWGKMTKNAIEIAEELQNAKEDFKIEGFLNSLPAPVMGNSLMEGFRRENLPAVTWPKRSIVWFCGKGFEKWDPTSLSKGVGGSETAVIYLSREWAKMGYQVTVFGSPLKEGKYDGVEYKHYWRWNPGDTFDIFIAWRNESIFNFDIKARLKLIDCHDTMVQADHTPEIVDRIDYYMVKSKYHRSFLPDVKDEKFKIISNGIEIVAGVGTPTRDPYLMSYVSSYDRGLEHLLVMWPAIKKEVPEARLAIAYGWNLFDEVFRGNPERQMWKRRMEELMAQDGIMHLGRINKQELHKLHRRSSLLAYYCTFEEINCISVLEAQLNGSLPVTTDYAALKETNKFGIRVPGDIYDQQIKNAYQYNVISKLKNPPDQTFRDQMHKDILSNYHWSVIAQQWAGVFNDKSTVGK